MLSQAKSLIKPVLAKTYSRVCQIRFRRDRICVMCPPIPDENLGDQAMVLGALAELNRRGANNPMLITTGPNFDSSIFGQNAFQLSKRHIYFATEHSFREECGLRADFAQARQLFIFGADVLDGHYGRTRFSRTFDAIKIAVARNVPVRIIGFSISETPAPEAISFLQEFGDRIELFPRDPVSFRRLHDAGISNLTQAADVAFLMKPSDEAELPNEVRTFLSSNPDHTLGVSLHYNFFESDSDRRTDYMVQCFREILSRHAFSLLFVPHHPADLQYLDALRERMAGKMLERCHFVRTLPSAPLAKRMFAGCRHVVTSRMHVAIAALSTHVPVTCFPYFGKFEGLFEHFDLSDGLIYADRFPDSSSDLADMIFARIQNETALREQIGRRLNDVIALAQLNFSGIPESSDSIGATA